MENESIFNPQTSDLSAPAAHSGPALDLLKDVELPVFLRFGKAQMTLSQLVGMRTGSVIELDRQLSDTVDVVVGGNVIARGEPVVVRGVYGVRISEVTSREGAVGRASEDVLPQGPGI